ncbi:MAG: LysR family transcriptional regulator [Rhodospirillales bacterium]|nr:LysR family transcriptional regulator [Rhodospirillales bacterium]
MTLKQLRFLREIARQSFSISAAAAALGTSQPAISRQIQELERELATPLLVRTGNRVLALTEAGGQVLASAERLLNEAEIIRMIAEDARGGRFSLAIATSHLHARYTLPAPLARFHATHPRVSLKLLQTQPDAIAPMVMAGEADLGVGTTDAAMPAALPRHLVLLAGARIHRVAIMPAGHALARRTSLDLAALGAEKLIGYGAHSPTGRQIEAAFAAAGIAPDFVVRASDSDVIKTYVAQGMGIGIVPALCMADGQEANAALAAVDVTDLLSPAFTAILLRRDARLRRPIVDFIAAIAPAWDRAAIQRSLDTYPPAASAPGDAPGDMSGDRLADGAGDVIADAVARTPQHAVSR